MSAALSTVHPDRLTDPADVILRLVTLKRQADRIAAAINVRLSQLDRAIRRDLDRRSRRRRAASRALVALVAASGGHVWADGVEVFLTADGLDTVIHDLSGVYWPADTIHTRPEIELARGHVARGLAAYRRRQHQAREKGARP
jgi:hypothetical protein